LTGNGCLSCANERPWRFEDVPDPDGRQSFARFATLVHNRVEPVYDRDVTHAAELADAYPELGGRDLLHAALLQRLGVTRIISADRGFDGIEWLEPANLPARRDSLSL
jgi:predicted nucleic acid-binding protein